MLKKPFSLHVDLDAFMPASAEDKAYMVQMRPPPPSSRMAASAC